MAGHYVQIEVAGRSLPIRVKRHRRARHVSLRMDVAAGRPVLVLPQGASLDEGLAFAQSKRQWLAESVAALPPRVAFADGALLPVLGTPHIVRHAPWWRGTVRRDTDLLGDAVLEVGGDRQHLARRLTDWLRAEARRQITSRALAKAAALDRRMKRITIRDTHSCWGSCSPDGALSFSWRLVLAPAHVLDYVVAHEVAHLVHLNHSRSFWRKVSAITDEVGSAQEWLRRHGESLLRYG